MSGQNGRPSTWFWSVALGLLCALSCSRAAAQQPSAVPAPNLAAGRAALATGDLKRAQSELEQAYQQLGTPELLGLLGQVASRQGQRTRAADLFRRYLTEVTVPAADSAALLTLIQSEQERGAEVVVSGTSGALLRVDDRIAGRLPLSRLLLLTPGPHRLALELGGQRKAHLVSATSGVPVSVRFIEDPASAVDAIETRPPVVLFLYERALKPTQGPLVRAVLDRVRLDGQAYDLAPERAERELGREPPGCLGDVSCLMRLAHKLGADYLLQIDHEASRFAVQVRDVAVNVAAAQSQVVDCSGRAEPECAAALRDAVGELLTPSLSRQHGRLRITSRPDSAAIALDEQVLDERTPHELAVFAGDHLVTLRKSGYCTLRKSVSVSADTLTMLPLDLQVDPAARRQHRLAIGKRVLAVAGALAIVGGAVAIGITGIQREDASDPSHYQELLSWPHGVAAVTVGAVTAGVAIWMHRKEKVAAGEAQAAEQ